MMIQILSFRIGNIEKRIYKIVLTGPFHILGSNYHFLRITFCDLGVL